jgi:hypothetical protein
MTDETADQAMARRQKWLGRLVIASFAIAAVMEIRDGHGVRGVGWFCLGLSSGLNAVGNHKQVMRLLIVRVVLMAAGMTLFAVGP